MSEQPGPLVFLDSNVLTEALIESPAACGVLQLAAIGAIRVVTCEVVVEDVEDEILSRAASVPENISAPIASWEALLQSIRLDVRPNPAPEAVQDAHRKYMPTMRHAADIPVLAAAIEAGADYILSRNRQHFNDETAARCGIPMMSPVEFLASQVPCG